MSFAIKSEYLNAVQSFDLSGSSTLPISQDDFDALVNEVAESIFAANQQKASLSEKAGRELSLREVFYLIVQDMDGDSQPTVTKIQKASSQQKTILSHACGKLETLFTSMEKASIQAATILFGINIEPKAMSEFEKMQKMLADLTALKSSPLATLTAMGNLEELLKVAIDASPTPNAQEVTPTPATLGQTFSAVAPAKKDA